MLTEGKFERVLVESRAEFIDNAKLKDAVGIVKHLEVAIGLESSNDAVLKRCVNKGATYQDYIKAAQEAKGAGAGLRTYLLVKPPFLTEKEAIDDAVNSARDASKYSDVISFNPLNVQKGTTVEKMWKRGEYRPPWLWSVVRIMVESRGLGPRIVSQPSGGGTERGAHNCGACDSKILEALDGFSLTGDYDVFGALDCDCRERWRDALELEGFMHTSGDIGRTLE